MRFGDKIENSFASKENHIRIGFFVRKFIRRGRINPGATVELTNKNGKFWEVKDGTHLSIVEERKEEE